MVSLDDLLDYTDRERRPWHTWFTHRGAAALTISAGSHGDGRFGGGGDLVRHIFSAEARYVDRLSGRSLTNPAAVPADDVEARFQLGCQSRVSLREFSVTFPAQDLDVPREFPNLDNLIRVTPRKIVIHVVLHESRYRAQVAPLLRLHGSKCEAPKASRNGAHSHAACVVRTRAAWHRLTTG